MYPEKSLDNVAVVVNALREYFESDYNKHTKVPTVDVALSGSMMAFLTLD